MMSLNNTSSCQPPPKRGDRQEVAEGAQAFIFSSHFCPFSDVYLENQAGQEGGQEGLSPAEQSATARKPPQTSHPPPLATQSVHKQVQHCP